MINGFVFLDGSVFYFWRLAAFFNVSRMALVFYDGFYLRYSIGFDVSRFRVFRRRVRLRAFVFSNARDCHDLLCEFWGDGCCKFCYKLAQNGWTALVYAGFRGRADCMRLLLDAGADKETKDAVRGCIAAFSSVCVCMCVCV